MASTADLLDAAPGTGPAAGPQDAIEVLARDTADDPALEPDPLAGLSDEEVEAQLLELLAAEAAEREDRA